MKDVVLEIPFGPKAYVKFKVKVVKDFEDILEGSFYVVMFIYNYLLLYDKNSKIMLYGGRPQFYLEYSREGLKLLKTNTPVNPIALTGAFYFQNNILRFLLIERETKKGKVDWVLFDYDNGIVYINKEAKEGILDRDYKGDFYRFIKRNPIWKRLIIAGYVLYLKGKGEEYLEKVFDKDLLEKLPSIKKRTFFT